MGPNPSLVQNAHEVAGTTIYEIDIRLLDKNIPMPSSFGYSAQKIISEIQQIMNKISPHPLEKFIIYGFNERFTKCNTINLAALSDKKSISEVISIDQSKFEYQQWYELQNKEKFLVFLIKLEKHYYLEKKLKDDLQKNSGMTTKRSQRSQSSSYFPDTIRKSMTQISFTTSINLNLLVRLFYHYYIVVLKTNLNLTREKEYVVKFHEKTGRNLSLMIFFNYLNLQQLFQLTYHMIYIQKHTFKLAKIKLDLINSKYHPLCLKNFYSIKIKKERYEVLQTSTRLYLDELYMNSVKEAEDPDIKPSDDSLLPIKTFPINRVKEKTRN